MIQVDPFADYAIGAAGDLRHTGGGAWFSDVAGDDGDGSYIAGPSPPPVGVSWSGKVKLDTSYALDGRIESLKIAGKFRKLGGGTGGTVVVTLALGFPDDWYGAETIVNPAAAAGAEWALAESELFTTRNKVGETPVAISVADLAECFLVFDWYGFGVDQPEPGCTQAYLVINDLPPLAVFGQSKMNFTPVKPWGRS